MKEKEIEHKIRSHLLFKLDISYYKITYTEALGVDLLSISFNNNIEYSLFVKSLDLEHVCDKSDYIEIEEESTILIHGMGLVNLYTKL